MAEINHPDTKAVPNLPFWMSQANQEFLGTPAGWSSTTLNAAGLESVKRSV